MTTRTTAPPDDDNSEDAQRRRIQLADRIVEVVKEYSDACLTGMGVVGYRALVQQTGLPERIIRNLRPLAEERANILYPGYQFVYDCQSQLWMMRDRPTVADVTWSIGEIKSADKQLRQAAKIGRMQNATAAQKLFAGMVDSQADQIDMIRDFAEREMR